MTGEPTIHLARVGDDPIEARGARLLVDRLWPRGLSREDLSREDWIRDFAPTTALRQCFAHEPARWEEFRKRYLAELEDNAHALNRCLAWFRKGPVLLVYAAKDRERKHVEVLRDDLCGPTNDSVAL